MYISRIFLILLIASLALSTPAVADSKMTNALSAGEEARRTVELMGGVERVRSAALEALESGGEENIAWAQTLADYLLLIDDSDPVALSIFDAETSMASQK